MDTTRTSQKYNGNFPEDTYKLMSAAEKYAYLFEDMLFRKNTISGKLATVTRVNDEGDISEEQYLPDEIKDFSYDFFDFHIVDLEGTFDGKFDPVTQTVYIDEKSADDDITLIHELIHLHEYVLDEQPIFYRDAYFWSLYSDLSKKIPDLDRRIVEHAHLYNGYSIEKEGGVHDTLFLLKSYDLDLRLGCKFGTVFGYGYAENKIPTVEIKELSAEELKQQIKNESWSNLENIIVDLYRKSYQVRQYFNTRYKPETENDDIISYNSRIMWCFAPYNPLCPEMDKAKDIIAEAEKFASTPVTLKLMLKVMEESIRYANRNSITDKAFYNSIAGMFSRFVHLMNRNDDKDLYLELLSRIEGVVQNFSNVSWGYGDEVKSLYNEIVWVTAQA